MGEKRASDQIFVFMLVLTTLDEGTSEDYGRGLIPLVECTFRDVDTKFRRCTAMFTASRLLEGGHFFSCGYGGRRERCVSTLPLHQLPSKLLNITLVNSQ